MNTFNGYLAEVISWQVGLAAGPGGPSAAPCGTSNGGCAPDLRAAASDADGYRRLTAPAEPPATNRTSKSPPAGQRQWRGTRREGF